ncbi:sodium-coupled monocarboxylate transporter 1-like isoform X3 [Mytilus californianus]|uniref:sodium-coupled monocarboxylate transporter 1-like isoform X3 n=1 Tax=Mytilus californianus TaxID=6549 RepID=UPI002247DF72|nr:sodium-coupled monocarboxylate transporter 1-like isoform X3 [Mytilus californianus]
MYTEIPLKMKTNDTFHIIDYIIFILTLLISTAIGIFYAWKDKKCQNTTDFLLGGRKMHLFPVTLSLMASFLSSVSVLGVPTEIFYNGAIYWIGTFSAFLFIPFTVHCILPVLYEVGLASAFEYLEMRFNKLVRIIGCLVFQLQMILYMAVVLYAPALALNQVMGIDMLVSILVIGLVCTFYTAIGGLKAVMWTDAFQMIIVFAGLLTLIIKATIEVGGIATVFERASAGGKLEIDNFDPSPMVRHTVWTLILGGFMTALTVYGGNQAMVQRYVSMKNLRGAQTALYLQLPASIVFTSLLVYTGLVLFAKYGDQNPVPCIIPKGDQLIPYLVMDVLGNAYGVPGLFVACIFSASLSTVSSGVNALALVFMTDIFKPIYKKITQTEVNESRATVYSKVVALLYGLLTIGLAFLSQYFGTLILQISLSIFGMVGGPLLALFVMALFFPCINSLGATIGMICSLIFSFWLAIGTIASRPSPPPYSCPVDTNATLTNFTTHWTTNYTISTTTALYNSTIDIKNVAAAEKTGLQTFYSISYLWYSTLAVLVAVSVALLVSCFSGGTKKKPVDRRLLSPLYLKIASLANTYSATDLEMQIMTTGDSKDGSEEKINGTIKENGSHAENGEKATIIERIQNGEKTVILERSEHL